jgi:hypothetical protein
MHSHEEFLGCGVTELGGIHDIVVVLGEESCDGVDNARPTGLS